MKAALGQGMKLPHSFLPVKATVVDAGKKLLPIVPLVEAAVSC